jgi:hypothetical protein
MFQIDWLREEVSGMPNVMKLCEYPRISGQQEVVMQSKKVFVLAALAGMAVGVAQPMALHAQDAPELKCFGVNSCKAHAGCSVEPDDVAAVKALLGDKDFNSKYGKTKTHSCGSHASCGASSKILNWTKISEDSCKQQAGIVIDNQDGKKVARKL